MELQKNFNMIYKKIDFLNNNKSSKKNVYLLFMPLLSFVKFWSLGGLDKGFYGNIIIVISI